jgi:hypothetical protein
MREVLESAITAEENKLNVPAAPAPETALTSPAPAGSTVAELSAVDATPAVEVKDDKLAVETPPTESALATPAAATPATPATPVAAAPAKPQTPEEKEAARQHRIDRAPQSWKKEAKGEWANMPLHVRQEIHKREAEINRALAQSAPDRQLAENFKQSVQPFMARLQANGIDPLTATRNLFEADHRLATGHPRDRAQYAAQLIFEYGIDIADLDAALAPLVNGNKQQSAAAQGMPDISAIVQQQLQQALAPIMQERQQMQQRSQREIEQTVEQMSLDPKYPFFDEVREDMADLIDLAAKRGVALSLEDAYTRAVRANPDTFGQLERQSTVNAAAQAHQAAMRAKAAASSVSGSPAGGGGQHNGGDGSLRSTIEAAFGGQRL